MSRLIAIGDVHGYYDKLRTLVEALDLSGKDDLVLLGDLVDRGPQSAEVIEYVLDLSKYYRVWTIMGNHDSWFLDYLESGYPDPVWYSQGGKETLDSYGGQEIPRTHHDFVQRMRRPIIFDTVVEDREYIFSHGMLSPTSPLESRFNRKDALWGRPSSFRLGNKGLAWRSDQVLVFGHTPHDVPTWYFPTAENTAPGAALCIDTGAGLVGRPLTAAILPRNSWGSFAFLQTDGQEVWEA